MSEFKGQELQFETQLSLESRGFCISSRFVNAKRKKAEAAKRQRWKKNDPKRKNRSKRRKKAANKEKEKKEEESGSAAGQKEEKEETLSDADDSSNSTDEEVASTDAGSESEVRERKTRKKRSTSLLDLVVEKLEVTGEVDDVFEEANMLSSDRYLAVREKVLAEWDETPLITCRQGSELEDRITQRLELSDDDTFYLLDLSTVIIKYLDWQQYLPRIEPFYAVKCNPDLQLTKALLACGAGMDVASKGEMQHALSIGVPADKIIFANPCKVKSHVRFAKEKGVKKMTFDNRGELKKVKECFPEAELIIRILGDDSHSTMRFGSKFGADVRNEVEELLDLAYEQGLNVIGVSFHVGSGCQEAVAYRNSIELAKEVFDMAASKGHPMSLLDIGGGMPGVNEPELNFSSIAKEVAAVVEELFPASEGVRVIAEPGRYFASECMVLVASVIAKRERWVRNDDSPGDDPEKCVQYYISEGVYGSFNNLFFDHAVASPVPLKKQEGSSTERSVVFGPTCDSIDLLCKDVQLPALEVGDFVYFFNMGAYTNAAASCFNGFERPEITYMIS